MILLDVSVLVYAMREDAPRHAEFRAWLERRLASLEPVGVTDVVLSGVVRVLTHPRIFHPPTPSALALEYVDAVRHAPNCVVVQPGPRHWAIFTQLCTASEARGNLVADAFLAAIAIESGSEWITADRDFSRFAGLRWQHPLRP